MSDQAVAARETQVNEQMQQLTGALEPLHSLITDLEGALSSILREDPPAEAKDPNFQESLVPLAGALKSSVNEVRRANERLQSVLTRLEL